MPTLPYSEDGSEYDVIVGGVPFRLATSAEIPQGLETVPVNKEQVDTERDPGEQSLAGFWRRSQSSFHWGAGYRYETRASDEDFAGFYDSSGVDVFTPGEVKLIRDMQEFTKPNSMTKVISRQGEVLSLGSTGNLYRRPPGGTSVALLITAPSGQFQDLTYNGRVYGVTDTYRLYAVDLSGASLGYWTLTPSAVSTSPALRVGWAKYRFWAYGAADIWQFVVTGTPDNGAAPKTPIFTNPTPLWQYTCMADGPSAVYFGGHDLEFSAIQMITLNADGSLPTLSGAITAALLPQGERITCLEVLAGQYVGIGTTAGFRVGRIESGGAITYGPLLIDWKTCPLGNLQSSFYGVTAVTSHGDSFYVAIRDSNFPARVYRVDTSLPLDDLVFPFASDIEFFGVAAFGSYATSLDVQIDNVPPVTPRIVATTDNGDIYMQYQSTLMSTGYITGSRIRYHTTEPKSFKYINLGFDPLLGSETVTLSYFDTGDNENGVYTWTSSSPSLTNAVAVDSTPMEHVAIKVTLNRNAGAVSPVLRSTLLRALPASKPQRLFTLPLLCYDSEATKSGQTYYSKGWARQRLEALQAFEDTASTLTYSRADTTGTQSVVIDSIQFIQTSPPNPTKQEDAGGILVLKLRTVNP